VPGHPPHSTATAHETHVRRRALRMMRHLPISWFHSAAADLHLLTLF
jgi:hypothetical protein